MPRLLRWCSWLYLMLLLLVWGLVFLVGDRWWLATIVLYGPRWFFALPLALLVPLVFLRREYFVCIPLFICVVFVFGPLMGFNLPSAKAFKPQGQVALRVLTYNINGGHFNAKQCFGLIKDSAVDLVAFQECPDNLSLPVPIGWYGIQKNGLALFSRYPMQFIKVVQVKEPTDKWPAPCLLHGLVETPKGVINVCSLQLPSPRFGLQAVLDRYTLLRPSRRKLLDQQIITRKFVACEVKRYLSALSKPVIVVGDFNTPADSPLFRKVWGRFSNAFSETGLGYGWTQRVSVSGLSFSARIDHVLTTKGLRPLVCEVGPDLGSDHLPLIADIEFL